TATCGSSRRGLAQHSVIPRLSSSSLVLQEYLPLLLIHPSSADSAPDEAFFCTAVPIRDKRLHRHFERVKPHLAIYHRMNESGGVTSQNRIRRTCIDLRVETAHCRPARV